MLLLLLGCGSPTGVVVDDVDTAADSDSGGGDTAPPAAPEWLGTGVDGALVAASTADLAAVAPAWGVRGVDGATVTVDHTVTGVSAGDEVLLLDVQGAPDSVDGVGTFLFTRVTLVSGDAVQLRDTPTGFVVDGHRLVLQRVPNFTDVTVTGVVTAPAWGGSTGGILAFRANGTVTVAEGGRLSVDGVGYAGGSTGGSSNCDGYQGESYTGLGDGGSSANDYNESNGAWAANGGGGGANVTGGGGEYGGGATAGDAWYPNGAFHAPEAGEPYGDAALTGLWFGSGGGGVWNDGTNPGPGGAGGGLLYVAAKELVAATALTITAEGASTEASSHGTYTYGAGGGAGGTIWLQAERVELPAGAVDAIGGRGTRGVDSWGGDGGVGRVRIDTTDVAGASLVEASEPDAYAGTLP